MKNDRWVFQKDIVPENQGNGVVRHVLAYSDDVMVVENTCDVLPPLSLRVEVGASCSTVLMD